MGESIHDPPPSEQGTPPPAQAVGDSNIFSDVPTVGPNAALIGAIEREPAPAPLAAADGKPLPSWAAVVPPGTSAPAASWGFADRVHRNHAESAPVTTPAVESAAPAWSGWSPDSEADTEDSHDGQTEEDLEPSGPLPPPLGRRAFPISALLVAMLEAVFLGIVLAFIRKQLMVPLVFHMVAGIALGWALGGVAKRGIAAGLLAGLTVTATLLMCLSSFGISYIWDRHPHLFRELDPAEFARLFTPAVLEWFGNYVSMQAEDLQVYGFRLGKTGAYLMWLAEFAAAGAFAWFAVRSAMRLSLTSSVPVEVLELVVGMRKQGRDTRQINTALMDGGWIDPRDQSAAQAAADAYLSLLPARKRR